MTRRSCIVVLMLLIACLVAPSFAAAHTEKVSDGNDVPGALDISSTVVGHSGSKYVRHAITTFDSWPLSAIDINRSPLDYLGIGFDLNGDGSFERFVAFVSIKGGLRAFWIRPNGRILDRFRALRPNGRSVSVLVPKELLTGGGGYEWSAFSVLTREGHRHTDWAPNGASLLHDLLPPKLSLGATYDTSAYNSATASVPIDFTVSDHTESAGVHWTLQSRVLGSSVWETADSGDGVGSHTAHLVGEDGGNYIVRLVARDLQGNEDQTISWGISYPIDDSSTLFSTAYTGSWSTTPLGDPYLGTLHSSSTPGASFTYTFEVTHPDTRLTWIGPGAPNGGGTASITFDSYPPFGVNQSIGAFDRIRIWEGTDPSLGMHTITITNTSGTIAIDGFVIR